MSPHPYPYIVHDLAPPPSSPPPTPIPISAAHTSLHATLLFPRADPPPNPFALSPTAADDTPPVVRANQNKIGACGSDHCFGLIFLAIGAGAFLLLLLIAWGLYKWRQARTRRSVAKDIERRGGAVAGRGDRDEFELANAPSGESVKKRRQEERMRKERDVKMGVGYQGRASQGSTSSILKAVQKAGDRGTSASASAKSVPVPVHDRRRSSFSHSQADTELESEFEDVDLSDEPPLQRPHGLAPHDPNHNNNIDNRVSALTTMGEIEAGVHVASHNNNNNYRTPSISTLAPSVRSLTAYNNHNHHATASSHPQHQPAAPRYPSPGSYGNFSGSRGSNSPPPPPLRPNPPYPDDGNDGLGYGLAAASERKQAIRDVCSVEELRGGHVRRSELGREF